MPRPGAVASAAGGAARRAALAWLLAAGLGLAPAGHADEIGDAIEASQAAQRAAAQSQQRIDALDDEARRLREQQRKLQWESMQRAAYAEQLERNAQEEEGRRGALEAELARVARTGSDLGPLMQRMVAELREFVAADLPFLQELRRQRVAELEALLADPGKRAPDKFRRVLEAYRTEVDYGLSIGAEELTLDCGGGAQAVSLLRIGRVGLYCQKADGSAHAFDAGRWQPLDEEGRVEVEKGLAMARGKAPAQLLVLPVRSGAGE